MERELIVGCGLVVVRGGWEDGDGRRLWLCSRMETGSMKESSESILGECRLKDTTPLAGDYFWQRTVVVVVAVVQYRAMQ